MSQNSPQDGIPPATDPSSNPLWLVASGKDRKWDELSHILQNQPQMHDAGGRMRKIIIFGEHRDTLNYLYEKISGVLGSQNAIVVIHGGVHRDDRRKAEVGRSTVSLRS